MLSGKKIAIFTAAAAVAAGGALAGTSIAGAAGGPVTVPRSAPNGLYACIAAGNKVANVYPAKDWHRVGGKDYCPSGSSLYAFPSNQSMQAAINAAIATVPSGKPGAPGAPGAAGAAGAPGKNGVSGYDIVQGDKITVAAGGSGAAAADCPTGKVAIGGGYEGSDGLVPVTSGPLAFGVDPTTGNGGAYSWQVKVDNPGQTEGTLQSYVVCADAQ